MAKRIKHVFRDAAEVCHIWAADRGNDDHGRSSNCYFHGDTLYSYGSHYVLGQFYRNRHGKRDCVIINDHRYSVTTTGHIGYALGAVQGLPGVTVYRSHYPSSPIDSLGYMVREKLAMYRSVIGKRKVVTGEQCGRDYIAWRKELRQFARRFKLRLPTKSLREVERHKNAAVAYANKVNARAEQLRQAMLDPEKASAIDRKRAQARAARERAKETLLARVVTKWKHNEEMTQEERKAYLQRYRHWNNSLPTMLRLNNDRVETSRGAMVTVKAGKALFALYQRVMADFDSYLSVNNRWTPDTEVRVEHYVLNHIDRDGSVQIGCHNLTKPEIDDFLERSGWLRQEQIKLVK